MERSSGDRDGEIWGTLEELLLVCAVDRHGARSWDSVALEIQSRSPSSHLLTPNSCRQRYLLLRRRFGGAAAGDDDAESTDSPPPQFPWLEELRKLRVSELRREVERYDRSIGSLQSKVKRLEEERERSVSARPTESAEEKPDQESKPEQSPETVADYRISGPSCEESNSTDPKKNDKKAGDEAAGEDPATGGERAASAAVAFGEGSCNGSTEGARPRVGGESGESIAESKGGEGEAEEKESSDVQSSASLSRRRRKAVSGSSSGGEEAEEVSRRVAAKPLVAFLEMVRSNKYGSVFDRRLESQESDRYRSLIRRHVDLDMVRTRLDRIGSGRPYAPIEFFRDLLLLCTNAVVFYPKDSTESVAAVHLRRLVMNEMSTALRQTHQPKKELASLVSATAPPQPKPAVLKPKPDPDIAGSLLDKPSTLIVCRKRSSINKTAAQAAVKDEKEKEKDKDKEEKPEAEQKVKDKDKDSDEKSLLKKNNTKERPLLTGTRSLRTKKKPAANGAAATPVMKRPVLTPSPTVKTKPVEASPPAEAVSKPEKKSGGGSGSNSISVASKKNNPATLLNRMKRSGNGSTLMESLKSSPSSGGGKSSEQKKGSKSDGRKEQGSGQGNGGGGGLKKVVSMGEESNSNSKRTVGRPPKRTAPLPTPPPAKRAKEEPENSKPPPASKKRARR